MMRRCKERGKSRGSVKGGGEMKKKCKGRRRDDEGM